MADLSGDELTDAIVKATRAMVGVAMRALPDNLTLQQFRALAVLATRGPLKLSELAIALGVAPSSGTRMCDRLVHQDLITRTRNQADQRERFLAVTSAGRQVVDEVLDRRRTMVRAMVRDIPERGREQIVVALNLVSEALGELPETVWTSGWGTKDAAS